MSCWCNVERTGKVTLITLQMVCEQDLCNMLITLVVSLPLRRTRDALATSIAAR
jgi:hypothetical protein